MQRLDESTKALRPDDGLRAGTWCWERETSVGFAERGTHAGKLGLLDAATTE